MLLEIKKLSVRVKSSGLKAVDGIDLSVNAGASDTWPVRQRKDNDMPCAVWPYGQI